MRKTTLTPRRLVHASARLMCLILIAAWGFMFISHLHWFLPPEVIPPLYIWVGQGLLLALLASYVLSFWKEKIASVAMISSAFLLFFIVVGSGGSIAYFLLSILPAILYFIASRLNTTPEKG